MSLCEGIIYWDFEHVLMSNRHRAANIETGGVGKSFGGVMNLALKKLGTLRWERPETRLRICGDGSKPIYFGDSR